MWGQGALTPDDILALAQRADCAHAEALVLSCTDMRSIEALSRIEQAVHKPVIVSNQAMRFAAMKALALPFGEVDCGQLFRQPATA